MSFFKKYWREMMMGFLTILLIIAIVLLWMQRTNVQELRKESIAYKQYLEEMTQKNLKILEENRIVRDSISVLTAQSKVIVVTKTQVYETVKKSPVNTNYSIPELNEWLYGSSKENGGTNSDTSTEKRRK